MRAPYSEQLSVLLVFAASVAFGLSILRWSSRRAFVACMRCFAFIVAIMISACGAAAKPDDDKQFFNAINQIYGPERNESAVRDWNFRKQKYENLLSRRFRQSTSGVEQAVGVFLLPSFSLVSEDVHGYKSASEIMSVITKLAADNDSAPATLWVLTKICERNVRECKGISVASTWPNRDPNNILAYTAAASEANKKGDAREATSMLVLGAANAKSATEYSDVVRNTAANAIRSEPGVAELDARLLAAALGQMIGPLDIVDLGALCEVANPKILDSARREACIKIARLVDRAAPRMMDVIIANMVLKALTESAEEAKSAAERANETERQIQIIGRIFETWCRLTFRLPCTRHAVYCVTEIRIRTGGNIGIGQI